MIGKNILLTDLTIVIPGFHLGEEAFTRLRKRVKQNGQTECLHVVFRKSDGKYHVLKGQNLLRALRDEHKKEAVCYVYKNVKEFEDTQRVERETRGARNGIPTTRVVHKPRVTPVPVNRDKSLKKVSKKREPMKPVRVFPALT